MEARTNDSSGGPKALTIETGGMPGHSSVAGKPLLAEKLGSRPHRSGFMLRRRRGRSAHGRKCLDGTNIRHRRPDHGAPPGDERDARPGAAGAADMARGGARWL